MKSLTSKLNIRQSNKGSALLTVVISMMFVIALGAALLFAAYTGYMVKITERTDKANFYTASSAMDDIRVNLQTKVTEAIAKAYTDTLVGYTGTHASSYNPQTDFNNRFIAELAAKTALPNDQTTKLFNSSTDSSSGVTTITGYNASSSIKALISSTSQSYSTVTGPAASALGSVSSITSSAGVLTSITLKSISLTYANTATGYKSIITTDITISMPYFFAGSSASAYAASGVNNYVLIANNGLIQQSTGLSVSIDGNVFIGPAGISVSGNGNNLTFTGGDVISLGPVAVTNTAAFNFNALNNELWVKNISLGATCSTTLSGKVFVANDLVLAGDSSSATLNNSYFGFGSSKTDPDSSSSILVSGRNSNLNISRLNKLSLAGVSFINISSDSGSSPIMMGQSMSGKSDQLAYLVPSKYITNFASNPCVFSTGASSTATTPTIDKTTVLWGTGSSAKTLSDYTISGKGQIQTFYKTTGSQIIAYVFLVFSEEATANDYFQNYFASDPSKISQYLSLYLSISDKAAGAVISSSGNTYYTDSSSNKLTLNPATDNVYADGYQYQYSKMTSPYLAYVNASLISSLASNTTLAFQVSGKTVAIIANGDYSYDSTTDPSDTVRLIIASGNVTVNNVNNVNKAFTGKIIAGNNITVSANVSSALLDSSLLNATCTLASGTKYTLSSFLGSGLQLGSTVTTTTNSWDLNSLVFYENWSKQ